MLATFQNFTSSETYTAKKRGNSHFIHQRVFAKHLFCSEACFKYMVGDVGDKGCGINTYTPVHTYIMATSATVSVSF